MPDELKVGATAVVTVTVEISGLGSYASTCQVDQIYRQSAREATNSLQNLFNGSKDRNFRIVGEPKVKTIFTERDY